MPKQKRDEAVDFITSGGGMARASEHGQKIRVTLPAKKRNSPTAPSEPLKPWIPKIKNKKPD